MTTEENYNWKFGIFYFNENNSKVFVPKRLGIGLTLNFAKWQSWLIIGFFLTLAASTFFLR